MKNNIKNMTFCILGSLIYCIGVNFFINPMNLYSGGFVGISQLLSILIPFLNINNQGTIYFILNIPLFILGIKYLGKRLIGKSIIIIIAESVFLSIIPILDTPLIDDVLTNCIVGGVIEGIGAILTFIGFGSSGGTDILGLAIAKKFKEMGVGKVSLIINIVLYSVCAYEFSFEIAIYSFLTSVFCSFVVDKLHLQNNSVSVNILSNKDEEIANMILTELNRDATVLDGYGMYSKQGKKLIVSIMSEYELMILKRRIPEIDENAFIFIHPNISVVGNFEKRLSK